MTGPLQTLAMQVCGLPYGGQAGEAPVWTLLCGATSAERFWNMDAPSTTALTASVASPMMVSTSMAARTTPSASASSMCRPRVMDCERHRLAFERFAYPVRSLQHGRQQSQTEDISA